MPVAHVDVAGPKVPRDLHQTMQVPAGVTLRAEEVSPHVVVGSEDGLHALIEVADELGTYESA
jgi:hypothetical protein